jgi:hypothetical protein
MPPKPPMDKRRKLLLYGGAAAVAIVLFLVARGRGGGGGGGGAVDPNAPLASGGAIPGVASDGAGGAGVDNSAQLAGFESDLLNQLPQAIQAGIGAGFANSPAPAPAGAPLSGSDLSDILGGVGAIYAQAYGTTGTGTGGEQTGPAGNSPSTGSSTKTRTKNSPSTSKLLAELKKPHSAAHQQHVKNILKSRGVKIPKHVARTSHAHAAAAPARRPTGRAHRRHG